MQRKTGVSHTEILPLPELCGARNPTDGELVILKRGELGYFAAPEGFDIIKFNRNLKVTAPQIEAMLIGSMFGFDVPGANPAAHNGASAKDWV